MSVDQSLLRPVIIGANHRSSSLALRDAIFVDDAAQASFLASLREAGLNQAVALSTCDRVEVLTLHPDKAVAERIVTQALAERARLTPDSLEGQLYILADQAAVRHCFAVTSSLDSLVIGEPHILGQVKACHRMARDAGLCGPDLEGLLGAAYAVAKRVRSETAVGERPVSIAAAAVQFARDLHGDLAECDGLWIGSGDMGELVAESLLAGGMRKLVVTAPRASQADAAAATFNCRSAPYEELPQLLVEADIVLCSVSGRHPVLVQDQVNQALRKRRRKPIFLVDTGIPGDVDPAVNRVDGAYLYDLTDLERVAMEGRATREAAAREAWAIIDEELATFVRGRAERAAVPAIVALRSRFELMREQVLLEAPDDADRATRLLIHRLLHDPTEVMKELAATGHANDSEWDATEQLLKRLFRLE